MRVLLILIVGAASYLDTWIFIYSYEKQTRYQVPGICYTGINMLYAEFYSVVVSVSEQPEGEIDY